MDDITTNPVNGGNNQANPQLNSTDVQIPGPVGEAASDTQNVPINTGLSNDSAQVPVNSNQPTQVPQANINDIRSQINALDNANNSNQDLDFDSKKEEAAPVATPVPVIAPTAEVKPEFKPTMPEENAAGAQPAPAPANTSEAKPANTPADSNEAKPSSNPAQDDSATDDLSAEDIINKDIFELMGVSDMSEEQKVELSKQITDTIEKKVFAQIVEKLSDNEIPRWKQLLETGSSADIKDFLAKHNMNLNNLMTQTALDYKTEMADVATPLRKAQQKTASTTGALNN